MAPVVNRHPFTMKLWSSCGVTQEYVGNLTVIRHNKTSSGCPANTTKFRYVVVDISTPLDSEFGTVYCLCTMDNSSTPFLLRTEHREAPVAVAIIKSIRKDQEALPNQGMLLYMYQPPCLLDLVLFY